MKYLIDRLSGDVFVGACGITQPDIERKPAITGKMAKRALLGVMLAFFGAASLPVHAQFPTPSAGLMPNPVTGKTLYEKNCAACHGIDLKGSNNGPAFIHRVYEPSHHGDPSFQLAVKNGVRAHHWKFGDMKPVPGVTPDEVAHITSYIREEQRRAGIH